MMSDCEKVVMTYFQAWQEKQWETMERCLSPDFKMDGGQIQLRDRKTFIDFCKNGPSWREIKLVDALFLDQSAALLYEGKTPTGEKIRVGEFLKVAHPASGEAQIQHSKVAISLA